MKKNCLIFGVFLGSLFSSCDAPPKESTSKSEAQEATKAADKVLEKDVSTWHTYIGTVPCADCAGIKMTLLLENNPNKKIREFKLSETYLGTQNGDRTFEETGAYEISYGTDENPGAMLISLLDENGAPFKVFLQQKDGNSILLLDKDMKRIDSELNYKLMLK